MADTSSAPCLKQMVESSHHKLFHQMMFDGMMDGRDDWRDDDW